MDLYVNINFFSNRSSFKTLLLKINVILKSRKINFYAIPAPHQVRDKLQPESSKFNHFWMPSHRGAGQAPQVRHDGFGALDDKFFE